MAGVGLAGDRRKRAANARARSCMGGGCREAKGKASREPVGEVAGRGDSPWRSDRGRGRVVGMSKATDVRVTGRLTRRRSRPGCR